MSLEFKKDTNMRPDLGVSSDAPGATGDAHLDHNLTVEVNGKPLSLHASKENPVTFHITNGQIDIDSIKGSDAQREEVKALAKSLKDNKSQLGKQFFTPTTPQAGQSGQVALNSETTVRMKIGKELKAFPVSASEENPVTFDIKNGKIDTDSIKGSDAQRKEIEAIAQFLDENHLNINNSFFSRGAAAQQPTAAPSQSQNKQTPSTAQQNDGRTDMTVTDPSQSQGSQQSPSAAVPSAGNSQSQNPTISPGSQNSQNQNAPSAETPAEGGGFLGMIIQMIMQALGGLKLPQSPSAGTSPGSPASPSASAPKNSIAKQHEALVAAANAQTPEEIEKAREAYNKASDTLDSGLSREQQARNKPYRDQFKKSNMSTEKFQALARNHMDTVQNQIQKGVAIDDAINYGVHITVNHADPETLKQLAIHGAPSIYNNPNVLNPELVAGSLGIKFDPKFNKPNGTGVGGPIVKNGNPIVPGGPVV